MPEPSELLNIKEASIWASRHIGKANYSKGITDVLRNARKFLAEDFDIFLVANDKCNIYPHLN